jgi:N-acetylmuramoyl-L-alanine amidase
MLVGQNFLHRVFARVSPVFLALGLAFSCAHPSLAREDSDTRNNSNRRQAAATQFAHAEDLRAELNSKPAEKRKLSEYKQAVSSYRRVYLITPHAAEVPDALLAVAELYSEMGDKFGRSYYQFAADSYKFLLHEYPTSHYGQDAMLRLARLQKDQLGDGTEASKTFQELLKKYPHSSRKREAQESLAELALLRNDEDSSSAKSEAAAGESEKTAEAAESARRVPADAAAVYAAENSGKVPRLRRIGTSALADSTRVTIDLEDLVQYASARIRNPDRIFFDLHAARLTPELARQNIHAEGDLLSAVRVAQNQAGVVRVVLNVNGVKDYTASLLTNPPQLVIDLYPDSRGAAVRAAKARRNAPQEPRGEPGVQAVSTAATRVEPFAPPASDASGSVAMAGPRAQARQQDAGATVPRGSPSPAPSNSGLVPNGGGGKARSQNAKSVGGKPAAAARPDLIQPASAALPTRDGQSTLTRTLGLKISRIVIDPGHGGHDTGTIGPTGLMEKDLCLDVALRLGKIIQQRLPGAEVVYTRSDDTFIPLEERTRVANESKADLFISIHANSSHDHAARGIETYYLNLKGSPDAMEVAARENATAQESIHDLEDIVKKIARSEKIDESREFAADIQESLARRIQKLNKTVKDRGVRKAPFVVLVGADMPSILTEISFLSNPADEQLLKKPEHRQRVAEGLYQGMANYLQSLNSMTMNVPGKTAPVSALVEQSRNQR